MSTIKHHLKTQYPPFKGLLELWILDAGGNELQYIRSRNLVVDTGREMAAGAIGARVNRIALGTNGATAQPGDVAPLTEQFAKALDAVSYPDQRTVAFAFTVTGEEFNGQTIREFGLIEDDGQDQVLFARRGQYNIYKDSSIQIQGTWTITF